jgi:hypothetical protein
MKKRPVVVRAVPVARVGAVIALALCSACLDKSGTAPAAGDSDGPWFEPRLPVQALSDAYRTRSYVRLASLFHDDFRFIPAPDSTDPGAPIEWGRTEELRIHRRIFEPQNIPPSETPLSPELWPVAISITISQLHAFEERPEYYLPANPSGLDPVRWKVWGADFTASLLVETQGGTHHLYGGVQWFVVAQDLARPAGDSGWLQIYRWQDRGAGSAIEQSWTQFKRAACARVEAET